MRYLQSSMQHRKIQINPIAITFKISIHFFQNYIDDGKRRRFLISHKTYHFVPSHYKKQYDDIKQYSIFARLLSTDIITG